MRPLRLEAEGFAAFRDRVDIDFRGADLFALVGPTGSGKSTVLDAICFALYGSVPRYANEHLVAPAITQGAVEARVRLTFEVEGDEYVATRVVRRTKSGASTKEARLERGAETLAGDAKEMNERVAALIGLAFGHFTRSVILPQNEFAQFLHDKPSDRQALIVELLDLGVYGRMRARAAARAESGKRDLEVADRDLARLADCTADAETAARAAAAAMKQLRKRLGDAESEIAALVTAGEQARSAAGAARAIVASLARVRVPDAARTLGTHRAAAAEAERAAGEERAAAEAALDKHRTALDRLPDPARLRMQLDAVQQVESIRDRVATLEATVATSEPEVGAARAALEAAAHAVAHAEAAFDAAVEDGAATTLAAALKVGEPCPVCEQLVTRKPKVRAGQKSQAQKAMVAARKAEAVARGALREHEERHGTAVAALAAAREQAKQLHARAKGAPPAEELAETIAGVAAAQELGAKLQQAFQDAVKAERDARDKIVTIDGRVAKLRSECEAQRDPLVSAGLDVPGIGTDLLADWDALAAWAGTERPAHETHEREQRAQAEQQQRAAAAAVAALVEECRAAGIAVPARPEPNVGRLRELVAAAEQAAATEIKRIEAGLRERAAIEQRITTMRADIAVATELARLLRSTGFEQWIVNEALVALVEGASATLEELSSGRYALAVDDRNEFEVVDHRNADERRPIKTLSGGETFQASLALALALADQVGALAAGGAAKLDAIFLDEGFGSLDADSLDTVATTLEALGGDARTVGIVTHVRDLAERVPVRFEVVKGPRTAVVTRAEA